MKYILGLDVGNTRVGVSFGSEESKICSPLKAIKRINAEKKIYEIIKERAVSLLVIGLPLDENNQETTTSKEIKIFSKILQKNSNIDIVFIDEYLTSMEAKERLHIKNADKKTRDSGVIDSMSATIILERYFAKECIILV